jgi:uncharacterized protein
MHFSRYLTLDLSQGKSIFLWGARQTGKTTYLKEKFPEAFFIDLLEADTYHKYLLHPERLREKLKTLKLKPLVILDEIQKVPALLDEVHKLIENGYQFILCGSSSRRLKQKGANLLGGRAWRSHFMPLCYPELKELKWEKIFNHGLIPSNYLFEKPDKNLAAYLYDYIVAEVQYEAQLRKREPFVRFLDTMGTNHGEMISFANIARDCGVNAKTVRSYYEILEDMYLGYFVFPYQEKIKRQTIQEKPKFYLFDTGLANYLKKYKWQEMRGADAGRAFEHYVFLELMAYKMLTEKRDNISYWRTKEGDEVDFVIQNNAIEVKMNTSISKRHIKGIKTFGKYHKFNLHIVCLEKEKRKITLENQEIMVWPIQEFLEILWSHKFWT